MTAETHFVLNGEDYWIHSSSNVTLLQLLKYLNYNTSLLVLEYNNYICNPKNWNRIWIQTGDQIEIVTIVGGG
jgi:sulfur carrier protein